ncbi:hypothetical protein [Pediococcus pentosaceus]|uniref:hypothetical protein n=1 Tax=Pediococcus pentosaceus TaxID=1255 RepID=UPI00263B48F9|nr:hypothetical protein [Pediococcus pentosaceus]MDN4853720.1 hypothetical protein [Pediococcus pentosaceus]
MSIKLITNELALTDPDFRNDLIQDLEIIENELNDPKDIEQVKADIAKLKKDVQREQGNVNTLFQQLASFMNHYDIPLGFRNGKIIDLEEEN